MKKIRKRGPRIKGICGAAKALGVTHQHLWAVLRGRRVSRSLVRRYKKYAAEAHARRKDGGDL